MSKALDAKKTLLAETGEQVADQQKLLTETEQQIVDQTEQKLLTKTGEQIVEKTDVLTVVTPPSSLLRKRHSLMLSRNK